jgi:transcriptional regulator with XRE-family HTH domain
MISPAQIRAARALLGMTGQELAREAGIGWATLQRFECAPGIPPSRGGTLERVQAALERAGITFIGDPVTSPGVQLRVADTRTSTRSPTLPFT